MVICMRKMTKRAISAFSALLIFSLFCGLFPLNAYAATDITASFTDPIFLQLVYQRIGKTAPEPIYDTDAASITDLSIQNTAVESLAGLQHFVKLSYLQCWGNKLLTALPALPGSLTTLVCNGNDSLTALPALPSGIQVLYCNGNPLLTALPKLPTYLSQLACFHNALTSLPELPATLAYLDCEQNALTALPELPASLRTLDCNFNQLTALPALPNRLQDLTCSYNYLTDIDLTGLALNVFQCQNNLLDSQENIIGREAAKPSGYTFAPQGSKGYLNNMVVKAEAIKNNSCTSASWNALKNAIADSKALLNDANAARDQIAAQSLVLDRAMNGVITMWQSFINALLAPFRFIIIAIGAWFI